MWRRKKKAYDWATYPSKIVVPIKYPNRKKGIMSRASFWRKGALEARVKELEETIERLTKGDAVPRYGRTMLDLVSRSLFDAGGETDKGGEIGLIKRRQRDMWAVIGFILNPRAEYNYDTEQWVVSTDNDVRVYDKNSKGLSVHKRGDAVPASVAAAVARLPEPEPAPRCDCGDY